ncbi:hypothetical protein B0H21DRAFT_822837 [Amylocystis lapponica]|nr:hypothetical protein B0H21DRAFT_822837 [Amylocystis lapponica]
MPISLTKESDVDVLIIGAGPAGLMCANALGRAGVNVRIIDQRSIQVAAGQADGIQSRTIEVLQSYGIADRLIEQAAQLHMAATLHQGGIEGIFLDSMRVCGVEVERAIVPTAIQVSEDISELQDPTAHPVRVVLKHLEAPSGHSDVEVVYAKFVVGADGAHSWVRKQFAIPMEGEQTVVGPAYTWGVVDIVPDTDFPDIRNRCAIHSHNGSYVDMLDPTTGRVDKSKMGAEQLMEVAQKSMHPYKISTSHEIHWWTLYIIAQRVAAKYSVHDRVFIAGDACHTHSPSAGQGMNASMNDTHNLAWKLAYVLRGWSSMLLLQTYESERRKYAQELIAFDKLFAKQFSTKSTSSAAEVSEDSVTHEQFLHTFKTFGGFTTGIGVHYSPSAIVNIAHQSYASKLTIGQRMPPHEFIRAADARPFELQDLLPSDARFKILVFAGNTTDKLQLDRVRVLSAELDKPDGFLRRFGQGTPEAIFDILCISSGTKEETRYLDVPAILRPHWSKVLLDDVDLHHKSRAGGGYESYGIDPAGAIVVVRPDGYVGAIAPFDHLGDINDYFATFMVTPTV